MAHLLATIDTPNKSYTGHITLAANTTLKDAEDIMRALIGGINSVESLSIEINGSAVVFGKNVLAESVITLAAVE